MAQAYRCRITACFLAGDALFGCVSARRFGRLASRNMRHEAFGASHKLSEEKQRLELLFSAYAELLGG